MILIIDFIESYVLLHTFLLTYTFIHMYHTLEKGQYGV